MESNNQKYQNNQMYYNEIQNQMNNQIYGMLQNQMNNQMFGMMQNPMNNQMDNQMIQNLMYNFMMYNSMNNGMISNSMNYQMNNGMLNNSMNNQMMQNFNNMMYNGMNKAIRINQKDLTSKNHIENIPIENATELKVDDDTQIKYYIYPKIDFTEEESNNSKVLLIIGQTGHGKTTFINALVNIYLGITINDKFRYLLVKNEDKNKSITKEITIYRIRPKKGLNFPPLVVIDTPGFGDTEGEEEDKNHLRQFREFFGSKKINNINCILYIIIGAYSKFGENDKNIINYLLNLFSKNLKENFVVGVTHFYPINRKSIPGAIKSLSEENHFYYQKILKNDNLERDQVLKSYWYFASDNEIISDNKIEGNEREKELWQYTEKQIINFIENKIKTLEKKNIKDSYNVLNNRFQLENEKNSFIEKIDGLISKKILYEFNLAKQKEYKSKIKSIRDNINNNNLEKKNIKQTLKEINNALPFIKKTIYMPIKTTDENIVCEKCLLNCHKNCKCTLTLFFDYFCNMISINGICKICNHSVLVHKKVKYIYKQSEENESLIDKDDKELKEYFEFLLDKEKIEKSNLEDVSEKNNIFKNTLKFLKEQEKKCNEDIKKYESMYLLVEIDIIQTLNNIAKNLDYLRENALNKESRTLAAFVEDYKEKKNEDEKKIIEILYQYYNNLINKKINIDDLDIEQYKNIVLN